MLECKTRTILQQAIENGISFGVRRAFKHADDPTEEEIIENVFREVMSSIDDVVVLTDGEIEWGY